MLAIMVADYTMLHADMSHAPTFDLSRSTALQSETALSNNVIIEKITIHVLKLVFPFPSYITIKAPIHSIDCVGQVFYNYGPPVVMNYA